MSISKIVNAIDSVYKCNEKSVEYTDEARAYRLIMLAEWAYSLGNYGWSDMSRGFKRHMRGEWGTRL